MRGCSFLMTVHLKGDCSLYFFVAEFRRAYSALNSFSLVLRRRNIAKCSPFDYAQGFTTILRLRSGRITLSSLPSPMHLSM